MKSAIEKEIVSLLIRFRYWLQTHDRGVILGLILSIPPIPRPTRPTGVMPAWSRA